MLGMAFEKCRDKIPILAPDGNLALRKAATVSLLSP
jgi:hypothetical protein